MSDDQVTQRTENSPREEIALRAYQLWEERGRPIGSPEEDWSRAENEMRGKEAAEEEWVRARNEGVRARNEGVWAREEAARARHEYDAGGLPPFTDFSGAL